MAGLYINGEVQQKTISFIYSFFYFHVPVFPPYVHNDEYIVLGANISSVSANDLLQNYVRKTY